MRNTMHFLIIMIIIILLFLSGTIEQGERYVSLYGAVTIECRVSLFIFCTFSYLSLLDIFSLQIVPERNNNIMIIMIIRKCMVFFVQNSTLTFRFASCLFSYYLRGLPFIPQSFYLFLFCFAFQSNSHSRSP